MDDRAVSELIGFVLVFSLIVATIGIVYVGGFAGLDGARDAERLNNAERAFDVLADNLEELGKGAAPSRATEIKLSEARIETSENRRLSTNATSLATEQTANPVSIRYRTEGETEIVYEAGAVIRTDRDGGTMLREPDFIFDENRTVIRYIEPRGAGQSVGGSTTVLVRGEVRESRVLASETGLQTGDEVTFNLTTAPRRAEVWERYLEEEIWEADACSIVGSEDETVTCTFSPTSGEMSLYVARTRVKIIVS